MRNEKVECEIKNTIYFTLVPPKMKYLDVNLTKHVQNLYAKDYKRLLKKIYQRKSLEWRARQRAFRLDTKSTIHKVFHKRKNG